MTDQNTPRYQLKDYIIDIYESNHHDIYVIAEYVSPLSYRVHIRRLDTLTDEGWAHNLRLLLFSPIHGYSEIVDVGASQVSYIDILCDIQRPADAQPLAPDMDALPPRNYRQYLPRMSEPNYRQIGFQEFNRLFDAQMVLLPSSFYAVGIRRDGDATTATYIYNEKYSHYYEIAPTLNFLINILYDRTATNPTQYFVICACDGFPHSVPYCDRVVPVAIADPYKYAGVFTPRLTDISENAYEVFHKNRWILTQNNHTGYSYTAPMPDHHYFVLNQYREFRWLHRGQPWDTKTAKVIFAGSEERSSKYNFRMHPLGTNSETTQRQYFYQLFETHPSVVAVKSGWNRGNFVSREEQMSYRYILDMDGDASTWDSLAWKLRSGSVLFRVQGVWNQWIMEHLVAGRDYMAIREDFSDLLEKYEWCETHPAECRQMVLNACRAFEVYRLQNAEDYVRERVVRNI
jgi:hypothetical protein